MHVYSWPISIAIECSYQKGSRQQKRQREKEEKQGERGAKRQKRTDQQTDRDALVKAVYFVLHEDVMTCLRSRSWDVTDKV